jgi:hypothetical protein
MNGFALFAADQALRLANDRAAELRREADLRRLVGRSPRTGLNARIAAAVSSVRAAFTAVERDFTTMPSLMDYPYRG